MISNRRNYIELFDSNGASVTAAENVLQTTLQKAGRYTVLVRSIFYSEAVDYNLVFQQLKNPCGATQVSCGQLMTGSITKGAESHLRTIDVPAGEIVRIVVISNRRNYIELFDSNGASVTAAENVLQTTLQQAGRYTVLVRSIFYSGAVDYNIAIYFLKNPCGAIELPCGQTVSRSITRGAEMHAWTIRVVPGEIVRFVMVSNRRNYMELFDANGASVGAAENVLQVTLTAGGRYTLFVRNIFYSEGLDYNLTFNQLVNPCPPSNCIGTLSPSSVSTPSTATTVTVKVTVAASCTWTAVSNSPWIRVTNVNTTAGTVTLAIDANAGSLMQGLVGDHRERDTSRHARRHDVFLHHLSRQQERCR